MNKSPDAFRTIGEVAHWLETPAHVLRFWESRFPEIAPVKRAGGRRYYRPEDMRLLGGIKHLLHDEGKTIKAVQEKLNAEGVEAISALSGDLLADTSQPEPEPAPPEITPEKTPEAPPAAAEVQSDEAPTQVAPEPASEDTSTSAIQQEIDLERPGSPKPAASENLPDSAEPATAPDTDSVSEPALQAVEPEGETPAVEQPEEPATIQGPSDDAPVDAGAPDDLDDLAASPLFSKPVAPTKPAPSGQTESAAVSHSAPPPSAKGFFFDDSASSDPEHEDTSASHRPAIYLEDEAPPAPMAEPARLPAISQIPDDPQDDAQLGSNVLSFAAEIRGLDAQDYREAPQQELLRAAVRRLSTALGEEI